MNLEEKAKTLLELRDYCRLLNQTLTDWEHRIEAGQKWVRLEDHQQEIATQVEKAKDPLQIKINALQLAILSIYKPKIESLERGRGLQKQKLQPFYDTLVAMVPKTVKIEEYDKGTKESWIVQTADPSEWSMFIDSLDGWLVKFKEMLK